MFSPAELQMEAFKKQLQTAVLLKKSVFLHQRLGFKEFNEIMDQVREIPFRFVLAFHESNSIGLLNSRLVLLFTVSREMQRN